MTTYVLVPGAWLGSWAWREVAGRLRAGGHQVHPLTLTGLAEESGAAGPGVDLATHAADIVGLLERQDLRDVVLVGHSYGGLPVTVAASRTPERIARVVYVDSGALPDGMAQVDMLPPEQAAATRAEAARSGLVPPPPWDPAADPMQAGIPDEAVAQLAEYATPQPAASLLQPVRREPGAPPVPMTLVACTFTPEEVRGLIAAGVPAFAPMADADIVPLPTGHWPMFSEPAALAAILTALR